MDERLGIVGSGAIATGLAAHAAEHLHTKLWARSPESAERARAALPDSVEVVTDLAELADRTVVVEAIVEEMGPKRNLVTGLGKLLADDDGLIATTTSSLSIAELAEASGRPDRFAGLHVFNPVDRMKLVELAFHGDVTDKTHRRMHDICRGLGKEPVEVPDAPGFVVNRLLFPLLFEAVRMLERERLEPEAIDTCMTLGAGHPMGPLALLDFVGLDIAVAIGTAIGCEVPPPLERLVSEGKLGRKTGAGFYEYDS